MDRRLCESVEYCGIACNFLVRKKLIFLVSSLMYQGKLVLLTELLRDWQKALFVLWYLGLLMSSWSTSWPMLICQF